MTDGTTLLSDGLIRGEELKSDLQTSLDVVGYIARKKMLISVAEKQKYFVHKTLYFVHKTLYFETLYFDLEMNGFPLECEYQIVRILGLLVDRRLTWHAHIQRITNQTHRAYLSIYHKYKNKCYITAS